MFEELKTLPKYDQTYVVPHSRIVSDGVRCGKTGDATEYVWLIPSTMLLDLKSAQASGPEVEAVFNTIQANGRMNDAFKNLISVDPLFVGVEMGDRYCGETLEWAKNSLYIYVQAENKIINFGPFGWIDNKENAMLAYHAPVGDARALLCIYKDSDKPAPNTPAIPSPSPPAAPLASPPANAFDIFPGLQATTAPPTTTAGPTTVADATTTAVTTTTATTADSSDDDAVCFPASAKVELESGAVKRMDELAIGDRVRVGESSFSSVFMFTHKLGGAKKRDFVHIESAAGKSIKATRSHYLVVNGGLKTAGAVQAGDMLTLATGEQTPVTSVSRVLMDGLYNPQTEDGRIVVDGVVASTYTTAVHPAFAHAVLAPLRFLYRVNALPAIGLFDSGNYGMAALAPVGSASF